MDKDIKINIETDGIEEATEELEALAEVYDGFPAQVTVKNCRNCTINIYPSQTKIVEAEAE
ncbi:MAG: hypothetical protein IKE31_09220, partial [Eubacterium sp.]|nr:hypothetical protein [Eubacterium sp.]